MFDLLLLIFCVAKTSLCDELATLTLRYPRPCMQNSVLLTTQACWALGEATLAVLATLICFSNFNIYVLSIKFQVMFDQKQLAMIFSKKKGDQDDASGSKTPKTPRTLPGTMLTRTINNRSKKTKSSKDEQNLKRLMKKAKNTVSRGKKRS